VGESDPVHQAADEEEAAAGGGVQALVVERIGCAVHVVAHTLVAHGKAHAARIAPDRDHDALGRVLAAPVDDGVRERLAQRQLDIVAAPRQRTVPGEQVHDRPHDRRDARGLGGHQESLPPAARRLAQPHRTDPAAHERVM
jgi:hypothetical protein